MKLRETFTRAIRLLENHSENIGGAVSFIGSALLLLSGGASNTAAAASFAAAELMLMTRGQTSRGYSAAASLMSAGDAVLAFAAAANGDYPLATVLGSMAAAWGVGAARYPLEKLSSLFPSIQPACHEIASHLPSVVGTTNISLRLPGLYAALQNGNVPLALAVACWGTSDVLTGRLQRSAGRFGEKFSEKVIYPYAETIGHFITP